MFVSLLGGLALGLPLAFVLGGVAVIFGLLGWGWGAFALFINRIDATVNDYILVSIPLFIFMAQMLGKSGVAEGVFRAVRYLFGPVRGGIAISVIVVSTLLAACTGITGAACVTMGLLALPIMVEYKYDHRMATGSITGSSALGILIPPSIMLIVMAEQSGETVGRLFAGAILPGLLLSLLFILYVLYQTWRYPEKGPALSLEERSKVTTRQIVMMTVKSMVPPLILIIGVLGSIFAGVATPTEAAAVGAFISFLMVIAYGRFNWAEFYETLLVTAKTSSMVLIIIIGATCFTGVFIGLHGGDFVQNLIMAAPGGRWVQFTIMMLICFFLGMFLDWIAIVMITFPIFLPIADSLGFDKLWFVVVVAVMLQDSFITPPFGYNLFYLKGIAPKEVSTKDIYLGAFPFWKIMEVGLILCVFFPALITWLPSVLVK
jgi:tripartite ATP-independent transporter DctM subunit